MKKYPYLLILICFFLPVSVQAQGNNGEQAEEAETRLYTPATVPSPKEYGQQYYVSDPDHFLRPTMTDSLNRLCHDLYRTTEAELAIVLISGFDEDKWWASEFCNELFNSWGIGSSERNTGVLLFFSLGTRDIRIHTGYGVEGLLPDAVCDIIIDNDIQYLSAGDYNTGIWGMANGIANQLLTDQAREELLLGWTPKRHSEEDDLVYNYLFISLIVLILLTIIVMVKLGKLSKASFDKRPQLIDKTGNTQTKLGCLSIFFPLTLPFLYYAYRKQRKTFRDIPYSCPSCGGEMKRLPEEDFEKKATEAQKKENKLHIFRFDYWECPMCGQTGVARFMDKAYSNYKDCKTCGEHALKYMDYKVTTQPTYDKRGEGSKRYQCEVCGAESFVTYSIMSLYEREQARIREERRRAAERYSSSGSGSSSGGSWGGGSSGGGGAGRKF